MPPGLTIPARPLAAWKDAMGRHRREGPGARVVGEEPGPRPIRPPVGAEVRVVTGRRGDIPIFAPFALLDAETHALAIDVGDLEMEHLTDAEACTVGRLQQGPMAQGRCGGEELRDLGPAENHGQLGRLSRTGNMEGRLGMAEGHVIEEP